MPLAFMPMAEPQPIREPESCSPSLTTWWLGKRKPSWLLILVGGCLLAAACGRFSTVNTMTQKTSVISGTVRATAGQAIEGARVYFISGPVALPDIAVLTDKAGNFSLSVPVAGTYELGCAADGFAAARVTVTVAQGQSAKVEIQLKN